MTINRKIILLLLFITILGGFQLTQMFFRNDDFGMIFKLQHPVEGSGILGGGYLGSGFYKYFATPYMPFYRFFGLRAELYFSLALLFFAVGVFLFYYLCLTLTKNKAVSFAASAIYATGYIGSETMQRMFTTYHIIGGLPSVVFAFIFLIKFYKSKSRRLFYYLLSVFLFAAALDLDWLRAHGLIFCVISAGILFGDYFKNRSNFIKGFIYNIPFILIYYRDYLTLEQASYPQELLKEIFFERKFEYVSSYLASFGHIIYPDTIANFINSKLTRIYAVLGHTNGFFYLTYFALFCVLLVLLRKTKKISMPHGLFAFGIGVSWLIFSLFIFSQKIYWLSNLLDRIDVLIGGFGLILFGLIIAAFYNKVEIAKTSAFALSWIFFNYLGFYSNDPSVIIETINRYYIYSSLGIALLWASIAYILVYKNESLKISLLNVKAPKNYFKLTGLVVILYLILNNYNQYLLIDVYAKPARKFYQALTSQLTSLEKGSLFYFDYYREPPLGRIFPNFFAVGTMPSQTAIAIFYGVDRTELRLPENFNELAYRLISGKFNIDNIHTFYYSEEGLFDTTKTVKHNLIKGNNRISIEGTFKNQTKVIETSLNLQGGDVVVPIEMGKTIPSVTPMRLVFDMKILPLKLSKYPYVSAEQTTKPYINLSINDKKLALDYLKSKFEFVKKAKVDTISEYKYAEKIFINDGNLNTAWSSSRFYYHDNHHEEVLISLPASQNLAGIVWINHHPLTTFTDYEVFLSKDGNNFNSVKKVTSGPQRTGGEQIIDLFEQNQDTKFVKLSINKTYNDDAPSLDEIWVLDSKFRNLNIPQADNYLSNVFLNITDLSEYKMVFNALKDLAYARLSWKTNRTAGWGPEDYIIFPLNMDGITHRYEIIIPPSGLNLEKIKLDNFNSPVQVDITNLGIEYPNLQQLSQEGYIHEIIDN